MMDIKRKICSKSHKTILDGGNIMKNRIREKTIYKNKNGEIIRYEDLMFGGFKYVLFDANGDYVKEIYGSFKASDYLE